MFEYIIMYKKRSKVIYNRTKMDQNWNKNETKSNLIKKELRMCSLLPFYFLFLTFDCDAYLFFFIFHF